MKNVYTIIGNEVFIQAKCEERDIIFVIDLCDLYAVNLIRGTWYGHYNSGRSQIYITAYLGGKITLHRYLTDFPEGLLVDHIDRDSLNHRRNNLRVGTKGMNSFNRGRSSTNASGIRGVYKHGNRWRVQLEINEHRYHLGTYGSIPEAALVSIAFINQHSDILPTRVSIQG